MHLESRSLDAADIEQCVDLLRGHAAYPAEVLAMLPRVWATLLRESACIGSILEWVHEHAPRTPVAFGMSVFVANATVRTACESSEPFLAARLIRAERQKASPILRPKEIRQLNAGAGLNLIVLHYTIAKGRVPSTSIPLILHASMVEFLHRHRGYRINQVIQEFWDEIDPAYSRPGWGHIRNHYAAFTATSAHTQSPVRVEPVLIGLHRDEVEPNPGATIMSPLFCCGAPRLGLSEASQSLLSRALLGQTDLDLARELGIALPTVKSRWRKIYQQVAARAPDVIQQAQNERVSRGKEKRRHVLDYVRSHPEELLPH